jgi:lysophospholipase L1-like esterase
LGKESKRFFFEKKKQKTFIHLGPCLGAGLMRRRLALLGLLAFTAAAALPIAARPLSRTDLPWWKRRHEEKLAEIHRGPVDLVWLGDSITQDWEEEGGHGWDDFHQVWQHYYGGRHAVDLGFKGDTTSHLLWRIENGEVDGISPRAAVVLIGANNFGRVHWGAEPTLQGIDAILAALHRKLPNTRILLLSVLPSIRSPWVDAQTQEVNRALAARDWRGTNVTFLDVSRLFEHDGRVDPTQFLDPHLQPPDPPLHPTAQAQARLAAAMEPALSAMLGDSPRAP